jgi:hypothetical protein
MLSFEKEVARYLRTTKLNHQVGQILIEAFLQVLLALDAASWETNLQELES